MKHKLAIGSSVLTVGLLLSTLITMQAFAQAAPTSGSCGSTGFSCTSGSMVNPIDQYATTGDYYTWDCLGSNGGSTAFGCTAGVASGTPSSPVTPTSPTGAQCTQGAIPSDCSTGYTCGSNNQCVFVGEGTTGPITNPGQVGGVCGAIGQASCQSGETCYESDSPKSYCSYPGSGSQGLIYNNGNSAIEAALSGLPENEVSPCQDILDNGNDASAVPATIASCEQIFAYQANALGYTSNCSTSLAYDASSSASVAFNVFNQGALGVPGTWDFSCNLSGSGVLGSFSGQSFNPIAVVGEAGANDSSWWTIAGTGSGNGTGSTGSGSTTGTGSTGSTGMTGSTSANNTTTGGGTVTVSNNTNAFAGATQSLTSLGGQLSTLLGSNGTTADAQIQTGSTATTSGSTGASSGSSSQAVCAAAAAQTVSSSLQTLEGLSTVLSSGNVSPAVLASTQTLINSVAQLLGALTTCLSS